MSRVLIIGFGVSGKAVYDFYQKRGAEIVIYDDKISTSWNLSGVDLVVKSPGISLSHPLVVEVKKRGLPLVSEIDLALKELKNKTLYGITGSNGKTTTTLLTTHLLKLAGKKAVAVGNIGIPLISQVDVDADYFVVELSSFQLESILPQRVFDGAVLLNLSPNHLDRHPSFEDYREAKLRLRTCLKSEAPFYVSKELSKSIPGAVFAVVTLLELGVSESDFYLHDLENAAAAFALTGVDAMTLKNGLKSFQKPAHRIEFVRKVQGIEFVNDSKATSVDAVLKAVEAMRSKVVLIAGGVDKGGDYKTWIPSFRDKVRKVFVLGESADRIQKALIPSIEVEKVADLEEGVKKATLFAKNGETVLLSPGCSSYDQFKNYEHRGERFKEMVCALEEIST